MIKYHPDTRFITDYAAGTLPLSQALCVSAHLHYCSACRSRAHSLTDLGAGLMDKLEPEKLSPGSFEKIKLRLSQQVAGSKNDDASTEQITIDKTKSRSRSENDLPRAINSYTGGSLGSLNWASIGKSFKYSNLNTMDHKRETTLFHIKAGGSIPKHHHRGDEITVVLKGSFSDADDHYHQGDFIIRTQGETHTPVASQDKDCLCLSTLDEPIVMNNWIYRLLVPLVRRRPAF